MARMPGARWRPIQRNYTGRRTTKTRVILHTTASASATSMHGWFSNPNAGASSHFHIDNAGRIEQYIDTDYISWANRDGNSDSVTIETQGAGNEPWTAAQVRAIVRVIQWSRTVHKGIPLRQMTSSARSQKGIGWHRLGVNGNFPRSGILRGRQQRGGGELWSGAYGKVCPGDARIRQIPAIIRQAGGHSTPATATAVTSKPKGTLSVSDVNKIMSELNKKASANQVNQVFVRQREYQNEALELIDSRASKSMVNSVFVRQREYQAETEELIRQLAEATGTEIDYDKVREAAKKGAKQALEEGIDIEAEVTFHNADEDLEH